MAGSPHTPATPWPEVWDSPKAQQIIAGATPVFLELGYEGASMDEVVRRAKVSKGTIYNYFPDKPALFRTAMRTEFRRRATLIFTPEPYDGEIGALLTQLGHRFLSFLLAPFWQTTFRIILAEVIRFPEIGEEFYRAGPMNGRDALARVLDDYVARGALEIDDTTIAASQFLELCRADVFEKTIFRVEIDPCPDRIDTTVAAAVRMFLKPMAGLPLKTCRLLKPAGS